MKIELSAELAHTLVAILSKVGPCTAFEAEAIQEVNEQVLSRLSEMEG